MDMTDSQLIGAIKLAYDAHECQRDKAGVPYFMHVMRVMKNSSSYYSGVDVIRLQIVGILHDIVEDTKISFDKIYSIFKDDLLIEALKLVTKGDSENYADYLYRIKTAENIAASSLACAVKLADLSDNADRNRISQITEVDERRFRKYAYAYRYLSETNECMLDYNLGRLREFLKSR